MRILVTGGAGYLGYSLIGSLLASLGDELEELVVYDNLSRNNHALFTGRRFNGAPIRYVNGEILDGRTLERECATADVVYHLAGIVYGPNSDRDAHGFDQVNNWGTAQVAAAVEKSDTVKDVIYLSSSSVYGSHDDKRSVKDSRPEPSSVYAISKLRGEAHINRLSASRRTLVVRCGNVYGYNPAIRVEAVVNIMAFQAKFNRRVTVVGSGKQHRAFIHVDRAAGCLAALPTTDLPSGIYDAVERNLSVLDIVDGLRGIEPDLEVLFVDQDMRMRNLLVEPDPKFTALAGIPLAHSTKISPAWSGRSESDRETVRRIGPLGCGHGVSTFTGD